MDPAKRPQESKPDPPPAEEAPKFDFSKIKFGASVPTREQFEELRRRARSDSEEEK